MSRHRFSSENECTNFIKPYMACSVFFFCPYKIILLYYLLWYYNEIIRMYELKFRHCLDVVGVHVLYSSRVRNRQKEIAIVGIHFTLASVGPKSTQHCLNSIIRMSFYECQATRFRLFCCALL